LKVGESTSRQQEISTTTNKICKFHEYSCWRWPRYR